MSELRSVPGPLAGILALAFGLAGCEKSGAPAGGKEVDQAQAAAQPAEKAKAAGGAPAKGKLRALTTDKAQLLRPTTAAIRGNEAWFAIGQLSSLFGDEKPSLPFRAVSVPLAGGELGAAIELPGPDYYPEGITAAKDGTLFVGSIAQGVISRVAPDSTAATPFVSKAGTKRGVIGMTVDEARQLLWFCDSDPTLPDDEKAGALVGVQLSDAKEVARHELPASGSTAPFCNDVIVSPDGALWITDSAIGRVLRVASAQALGSSAAEEWLSGGPLGPPAGGGHGANGLEWMDGVLVVSNVGRGTLVALDPESKAPTRGARAIDVVGEDGAPTPLCSPDGLARLPGSKSELVVVENGGCAAKAPRVAVIALDLN